MDALMLTDVMALKDNEISKQTFAEKLALNKHKFNTELETKVKDMLPNKKLPKIGKGYIFHTRSICHEWLPVISQQVAYLQKFQSKLETYLNEL